MTKTRWKNIAQQILGALTLGAIVYASYHVIVVFYGLEKEIKVSIIAATSAFALALISNYVQKQKELDFRIREKKIDAYQKFFDFLLFFLKSTNTQLGGANASGAIPTSSTELMIPKIYEVNYALIVSGSDLIIRQWHDFLQSLKSIDFSRLDKGQAGIQTLIMRQKLAEIIQSIRRDLGHRDKAIDLATISDVYMPLNFTQDDWVAINAALDANKPSMGH